MRLHFKFKGCAVFLRDSGFVQQVSWNKYPGAIPTPIKITAKTIITNKLFFALFHLRKWKRILHRRAIARLMIDFGTPCHKNRFAARRIIDALVRPASATTTQQNPAPLRLPHMAWRLFGMQFLPPSRAYSALRIGELPCRLPRTKNHHFALAPFPWFSAKDATKNN